MKLDRKFLTAIVSVGVLVSMSRVGMGQADRPANRPTRKVRELSTELFHAVTRGDVERIKQYLDDDPSLLADGLALGGKPSWSDGFTLLHDAVRFGQLGVVEELLRRGADVNARVVRQNKRPGAETPLHVAAGNGRSHIIPVLLKHGADIEALDDGENTPLRWALFAGYRRAARILGKAGARQDVFCAAGLGNVTLLEQFLNQDPAEANARTPGGSTPLHYAASTGEVATAKVLLARGAAIDPQDSAAWGGDGNTPLHRASLLGHLPMCRLLVESGADFEKRGHAWTPLHSAAIHGNLEVAEYLISKGASISSRTLHDDSTPLHEAALFGHVDMAKLLLRHGADINAEGGHYRGANAPDHDPDEPKPTPLDKAVSCHHREMARFLVGRGARLGREKPNELQKLLQPADDAAAK